MCETFGVQETPTITAAEIARLAGVGRAAVSNWRKRHADFPTPAGGTATSPEFDLIQVEQWLRAQGKLPELATADRLWRHLAAASDSPTAGLAAVGARLLARQRRTRVGPPDAHLASLLPDLDALADEVGPQGAFDELWQRFSAPGPGRPFATPDDLADLMVGLADVGAGSVLDPAMGSGATLRAAARAGCTSAYGQELDPDLAALAGLWLALRDVPGEVVAGDSLRADAFAGRTVDAVVCHPPFGATNWGDDELGHDPRWIVGTTPRTEPELAWVQHALAHLRVGGHAVLLMPPTVASRRAGKRIRSELLRRGHLRAVVA
ncbi:N-6 DNA methylase, partial [Micromonospora sp. NPDC049799]|uniref:HsdM family class I SAM-dependent methyltransferase n=1 Tax=Micromonospora sp. NPDC049799 TaxID=3154741 RepID=UPI0033DD418A